MSASGRKGGGRGGAEGRRGVFLASLGKGLGLSYLLPPAFEFSVEGAVGRGSGGVDLTRRPVKTCCDLRKALRFER